MKRASGVMTGFEDDDRWGNHDDDDAWGAPEREVDAAAFDTKEEAAMEAFVEGEVRSNLGNEKKAVLCVLLVGKEDGGEGGLDMLVYSLLTYTPHARNCTGRGGSGYPLDAGQDGAPFQGLLGAEPGLGGGGGRLYRRWRCPTEERTGTCKGKRRMECTCAIRIFTPTFFSSLAPAAGAALGHGGLPVVAPELCQGRRRPLQCAVGTYRVRTDRVAFGVLVLYFCV